MSVIVITYNREVTLLETVSRLLEQEYANYEIVVVDQTDAVPESTQAFFARCDQEKVKYVHIDKAGLPNARNVGIRVARGDIVLFIDDDAVPCDERFVKHHAENYLDPKVVGVSGRIIDPRFLKVSDAKDVLKLQRWGAISGWPNSNVRAETDVLQGGNMSFGRKAVLDAGLFSESIIGSAQYEDTEISLKLQKTSGGSFVFDPRAAVFHKAVPAGGCDSRSISPLLRHVWRFHNMTFVCLQNPDRIDPILFLLGRLVATARIAVERGSLKALYWLPYAVYLGFKTHRTGHPPEREVVRVVTSLSIDRGAT